MKDWIAAFRLRSLPLALACIGMGSFLAAEDGQFQWLIFFLSSITTIFLQILSNLANDYGDSIHGADSIHRKGPQRAVQSGAISLAAMKKAMVLFAMLAFLSGIYLIYVSIGFNSTFLIFLILGILSIYAAITYTAGSNPYGYVGLGDLSVFVFFGWLGVLGTYYLHAHQLDWIYLLPASSCSFFAVAVLNVNNIRDIDSDRKAGKRSIPVRIGRDNAVKYHWFLLLAGVFCAILYVIIRYQGPFQLLFLLVLPLLFKNAQAVHLKKEASELDPYLKQMALTTLFFVIFFGIGQLIT